MIIAVGIGILAGLLWHLVGNWEWQIPERWAERLARWGEARRRGSRVLRLVWYIEDEQDFERRYWEMRRYLPTWQRIEGKKLWIEISLYVRERRDVVERVQRSFQWVGFVVRDSIPNHEKG